MKIHSFTLIAVFLLALSSVSYAETLDSREISGTKFTLLSNTEQCLVDCEAIVEWDLTKGILSNVQLPVEANSQFDFEVVKKEAEMAGLESFGVEVWEEKAKAITEYCNEEEIRNVPKKDLTGTCEENGCIEKDALNCSCTYQVPIACGSHFEWNWEKVAESIYGFEAIQGKVYRLRVWGKRKAGFEQNSVDWIPTFFGEEITEWAWWNAEWKRKMPITLNTSLFLTGNVTQDTVIAIDMNSEQSDFWNNVEENGYDVRFVNAAEDAEYDYYFERFNYSCKKMVAWVEIGDTFPSATDLEIYVYYKNAAAPTGQKFEGDVYPAMYVAGWDFNESTGATGIDVVSGTYPITHVEPVAPGDVIEDSNGVKDGAILYSADGHSLNADLFDGGIPALSYSFWFSPTGGFTGVDATTQLFRRFNGAGEAFIVSLETASGKLRTEQQSGGAHNLYSNRTTWDTGTYYHTVITFDPGANVMNMWIDGGDNSTLAEPMQASAAGAGDFYIGYVNTTFDGNMDAIRVFDRALTADEAALIWASESSSLQVFGEELGGGIDLNITTINGTSYLTNPVYVYGADGNITIDFNVFDTDNNRLTIDLNYSTTSIEGGGTRIVDDLNLTPEVCPNQTWNVTPSECSWSWNYSEVDDGNYYIKGLITDKNYLDFNSSASYLIIANDVNIIVHTPIDEDTGLEVVTSAIGYSVKITTDLEVNFYDDMVDTNGFPTAKQLNAIIVKIDVNKADEYYSRQYALDIETTAIDYHLYPYLAPVAKSGNFIFYVTNITTTGPLEDVTINITSVIPGEGETEIQEIITDSAGTATIPLLLDTTYTITFTYASALVHTATVVPTAGSLTYRVGLDISSTIAEPDVIGGLLATWLPTTIYLLQESAGGVDINADITMVGRTIEQIQIRVYDTNGCLYAIRWFDEPWTDGNRLNLNVDVNDGTGVNVYTGLACVFDSNTNINSIYAILDVNTVDGNNYSARSINWQVVQLNNYRWNVWYRMRLTADLLNSPGSLLMTSILAFFTTFLVVFAAAKMSGNAFISAMVGLSVLGWFVMIGWFDISVFAFIAFATVMFSLYSEGKIR